MQTSSWWVAVVAVSILTACSANRGVQPVAAESSLQTDTYLAAIQRWRDERESRLRSPDGWLSFVGSGSVAPGSHAVGSAADNQIVLPAGPAHWGVLHLDAAGGLRFDADAQAGLTVEGQAFQSLSLLDQRQEGGPTSIHAGALRFYVVRTGELHAWRLRDPAAAALRDFTGVPHFPVDPAWRVDAQWQAFVPARQLEVVTSNGTLDTVRVPGQAVFQYEGREYALWPVQEKDGDELFFIMADRSSGRQTYGGGRFLYAAAPVDGRVELDFNKAVNPPCALNGHVVCPLAPPENRLDLYVRAGETLYGKAAD